VMYLLNHISNFQVFTAHRTFPLHGIAHSFLKWSFSLTVTIVPLIKKNDGFAASNH
jgi:hypothetical protein